MTRVKYEDRDSEARRQLLAPITEYGVRAVSVEAGYHPSTVSRWLAGKCCITDVALDRIAAIVELKVSFVPHPRPEPEFEPCPD